MSRGYAQRQDSYWFPEEWNFLDGAVKQPDVQDLLTSGDNEKARGVLVEHFCKKFMGPVEGESDADFKKRLCGTSKSRKDDVYQRTMETQEAWTHRMQTLPDVRHLPFTILLFT